SVQEGITTVVALITMLWTT
nr:immunoglobulin heavy chain junction region [Mus musculus]